MLFDYLGQEIQVGDYLHVSCSSKSILNRIGVCTDFNDITIWYKYFTRWSWTIPQNAMQETRKTFDPYHVVVINKLIPSKVRYFYENFDKLSETELLELKVWLQKGTL